MEKKQILIQGKVLSYYQSWNIGKIWVLVFLHGWMQDGTSFRDIFTHLEGKNIPYISFDLPGFGSSALLHDNMTIEEYGEGVIECIEKLWLTKPVLVWHSFWGRISIYLWSFYTNISLQHDRVTTQVLERWKRFLEILFLMIWESIWSIYLFPLSWFGEMMMIRYPLVRQNSCMKTYKVQICIFLSDHTLYIKKKQRKLLLWF